MCGTCGCNVTEQNKDETLGGHVKVVDVLTHLLGENDDRAARNRAWLGRKAVVAINMMSSPGSGKTRLLEKTIEALASRYKIAVIEGDLETENDAERIRKKGVPAVQITTGTACHLDAQMVHDGLHELDLDSLDIVFIENVGNLVCPASFDLGQHANITLVSVTEGDDKPEKYPVMFKSSDLTLITKTDLLPYIDEFDCERAVNSLRSIGNQAPVMQISAKQENIGSWLEWMTEFIEEKKSQQRAETIQ